MFIAISKIDIDEKMANQLEASFKDRSRIVDSFDGFIGLSFLRSKKNPNQFLGIFKFNNEESFKKYMKSDIHTKSHQKTQKEITKAIQSNSLEFFTEITN